MKERKKRLKRLLAVALSLVVIGGSANLPVLTSFAEDEADGSVTPVTQTEGLDVPETEPEISDAQTPAPTEATPAETEGQGDSEEAGSEGETSTINVEVKGTNVDLPDNDELFAGYVDQLFYAGANDGIATLGEVGADKLTDPKKKAV